MWTRVLLALCATLVAVPAAAGVRVMTHGDSITAGNAESSWPAELQRLRPDLDVVNEGRAGDVSDNVERFRQAITDSQPQVVVMMLGINDPICSPANVPACAADIATPERTVSNLLEMANEAHRAGASVVILTPTPAVCTGSCEGNHDAEFAIAMRQAFTDRVATELRRARLPAGVRVGDLRGRFTDASWTAISTDGVHPSPEGNRIIAEFVSTRIPRPGARRPDAPRAAPSPQGEPDPFVRRPPGGTVGR